MKKAKQNTTTIVVMNKTKKNKKKKTKSKNESENPCRRWSSSPFYECTTVLLYGVPIVDFQITQDVQMSMTN